MSPPNWSLPFCFDTCAATVTLVVCCDLFLLLAACSRLRACCVCPGLWHTGICVASVWLLVCLLLQVFVKQLLLMLTHVRDTLHATAAAAARAETCAGHSHFSLHNPSTSSDENSPVTKSRTWLTTTARTHVTPLASHATT